MANDTGSLAFVPAMLRSRTTARYQTKRSRHAALCLKSARAALAGFRPGEHIFGVTLGQFSMIDLAAAALEITGPADVTAWTWCIADYEVQAISRFLDDGQIRNFRLVIDWAGSQRDMPIIAGIQARFGLDAIRVTKTHAKMISVCNESWAIAIRGSMNLNANPRLEQFDVSDNDGAAAVMLGIAEELWARAKPLPVSKLRHAHAEGGYAALGGGQRAASWADGLKEFEIG